ncbi:MAG: hypothetical protein AAF790_06185 [Planctomycetota bacterium]
MTGLDHYDALIAALAVVIAVSSLTGLMRARRNRLIEEVRQQLAAEQQRRRAEAKRKKKQEAA